jgi:uncharacterized PurR-regulated membrane protein YhhQ (DUF165 family)
MALPRGVLAAAAAMIGLIVASNILVQYPLNDWLTWGALLFPVCFLVTDLTNRGHGASATRKMVLIAFPVAIVMSMTLATPRIGLASGTAFLVGQMLDVAVFDRLRRMTWWQAPLISSVLASAVDTALFFSLAFYATPVPWVTLGIGDFFVKVAMALAMLIPFRALMPTLRGA